MIQLKRFVFLQLLSLLLLAAACTENPRPEETSEQAIDSTEVQGTVHMASKADIVGHWVIKNAWRDGSPAASLDDAFFEFGTDNIMSTNILGEITANKYVVEDQVIYQKGDHPISYTILGQQDSTLVLNMTMRGVEFKFALHRDSM